LSFIETAEAGSLDCRDVDKHILAAALRLNKSIPLLRVEPLHSAFRHIRSKELAFPTPSNSTPKNRRAAEAALLTSGNGVGRYQGPRTAAAITKTGTWKLAIIKRDELHRFLVLPKRWIVERTLAWISRNRRLARDFECYAQSAAAFIRLAMIRIMLRRLTRPTLCS
jgi:hypothetical protein